MTTAYAATTIRPRCFHRLLLPAGALLLVAGLVGVIAGTRSQGSSPAVSLAAPSTPASASGLQAISSLQNRLRTAPRDADSWGALGSLYVDQARVTADPTWYGKAQGALRRSLELKSAGNVGALIGLGKLANARHDFAGGLRWGEQAKAAAPGSAAPYGVVGDALIELGRYPDAFAAIQRMVDLRPDLASYSRVSYARELQGDVPGAAAALDAAVHVADNPADAAFATFQIGELRWNAGDLAGAADAYERATRLDPTFAPPAAALARLHAAEGNTASAIWPLPNRSCWTSRSACSTPTVSTSTWRRRCTTPTMGSGWPTACVAPEPSTHGARACSSPTLWRGSSTPTVTTRKLSSSPTKPCTSAPAARSSTSIAHSSSGPWARWTPRAQISSRRSPSTRTSRSFMLPK